MKAQPTACRLGRRRLQIPPMRWFSSQKEPWVGPIQPSRNLPAVFGGLQWSCSEERIGRMHLFFFSGVKPGRRRAKPWATDQYFDHCSLVCATLAPQLDTAKNAGAGAEPKSFSKCSCHKHGDIGSPPHHLSPHHATSQMASSRAIKPVPFFDVD